MQRISIKNHHREIQLITKRAIIALIFVLLLTIALIARLSFLQVIKHPLYVTLSQKNWLDLAPVEPTRGLIYDRNGVLLADNIPVFSLDVLPVELNNIPRTLNELSKLVSLTPYDIEQFNRARFEHRRFDEIPLKLRLTDQEVASFTENQYRFPGVFIKARLMRHYPYNDLFAPVLGYVGRINAKELNEIDPVNYSGTNYIGKLGIEKFYETALHGKTGFEEQESDVNGKPIRTIKEIQDVPGDNLYLTIDSRLQMVASEALNGDKGAVVAIDPRNGEVLAMVSNPSYDPNVFVAGISQKDYQTLANAPDHPLFNRVLRGLYALGSTIKPYYAIEGLDSGATTPDFTIQDPGWFDLNGHRYHDWRRYGHGTVNIAKAIMVSCDVYFYQLSLKMGIAHMDSILGKFGFGQPSGIDVQGEVTGLVASPIWKEKTRKSHWYLGDTVNAAIGQGYMQATPLQLADAVATIANRGQGYVPHLLLREQAPNQPTKTTVPTPRTPVVLQDPKTWDLVIGGMQNVVAQVEGTAHTQFGTGYTYTLAAKTGTAQLVKRHDPNHEDVESTIAKNLRDNHLFIVFAPADQPRIALAIITENDNAAVQAARTILDYFFNGKMPNVPPPAQKPAQ